MADINDGTGAGLLAFLTWTIEKNELNTSTAQALRTASKRILEVEDSPDDVDLRSADLENLVARFTNKSRDRFNEASLRTYQQRFRQSVEMYIAWLDGHEWRPARPRTRTPDARGGGAKTSARTSTERSAETTPSAPGDRSSASTLIEYPFPIRPGLRARLWLPENLTAREAQRLADFMCALAVEEPGHQHQIGSKAGHGDSASS